LRVDLRAHCEGGLKKGRVPASIFLVYSKKWCDRSM
jgi:hypothetical protein